MIMKQIDQTTNEKSLQEILQDLVNYCVINGTSPVRLSLTLPKDVLNHFSKQFTPISRNGNADHPGNIRFMNLMGGTVEFKS
jgi:hypothetical protein